MSRLITKEFWGTAATGCSLLTCYTLSDECCWVCSVSCPAFDTLTRGTSSSACCLDWVSLVSPCMAVPTLVCSGVPQWNGEGLRSLGVDMGVLGEVVVSCGGSGSAISWRARRTPGEAGDHLPGSGEEKQLCSGWRPPCVRSCIMDWRRMMCRCTNSSTPSYRPLPSDAGEEELGQSEVTVTTLLGGQWRIANMECMMYFCKCWVSLAEQNLLYCHQTKSRQRSLNNFLTG